jgi:hypothetical protein
METEYFFWECEMGIKKSCSRRSLISSVKSQSRSIRRGINLIRITSIKNNFQTTFSYENERQKYPSLCNRTLLIE